jgi:hypothetical protein
MASRTKKKNYKVKLLSPKILLAIAAVVVLPVILIYYRYARAFQVDPLPSDNLVQNPWFRSASNSTRAGMDGWTNVGESGSLWTLSQKSTNPSPDMFVSGRCGNVPDFCGTAAKLAADDAKGVVGADTFLYQVITANPENKKLKFFMHWVAHEVNPLEVVIYGGESAEGPWIEVWKPFYQVVDEMMAPPPGEDTSALWQEMTSWTPPVETLIPVGFSYYKVQIRANLSTPEGVKLTGVYFTAVSEFDPTATPTPITDLNGPTATPTPTPNPLGIHVGDLDGWGYRTDSSGNWKAQVQAEAEGVDNAPIEGVLVSGVWSSGVAVSNSCTTDSKGVCSVFVEGLTKSEKTVTFTVTNLSLEGYNYESSMNHDPDGDSDGTSITVSR